MINKQLVIAAMLLTSLSACVLNNSESNEPKSVTTISKSTYARVVPERKDDFAWENDLIAFRAYGPALRAGSENAGVDCWLKRVDYPIINKWYRQAGTENKSYHEDHGEGLDNYHVGSSAGCGGTSLWLNGERQPLETYTKWEIVSASPEKTVFILHYQAEIAGDTYQEQKQITIELGQRLYKAQSTFYKNGQVAKNLPVTVGLTTHDGKAKAQANLQAGWLMAWEVLGDSELGTGVLLAPQQIEKFKVIESGGVKDKGHAVFVTQTDSNGQLNYYSGYGWKKAGAITTPKQWQDYLTAFNPNF
ncbi:MAG: DUF4861 family protein [Thalassotalea sp.]